MSVICYCATGVMDLSGVFCVADSGVLQDTFLWNSMGMHTCSVWFSNNVDPADVPAAIMVLTNHRGYGGSLQRQVENLSDGLSVVSFAQQSNNKDKIKCYHCNKRGHIARDCPGASDNQESKRGGSDDNDSAGSGGGKVAWNFSQVERDVKWQKAMDNDSLHF